MTPLQKLMCDQLEVCQAMTDAYQGLYFIAVAAVVKRGIKPYNWPEIDEQVFFARYKLFASVPVPRFVDYKTFISNLKHEIAEFSVEQLINEAKGYLNVAQQRIGRLAGLDESMRNSLHWSQEKLLLI